MLNTRGICFGTLFYRMDKRRRKIVLQATLDICSERGWETIAAHIRTTHGHIVVQAACHPDIVEAAIKARASRRLNQKGVDEDRRGKRWAKGASKIYLWTPERVQAAIDYVLNGQGERMEWYSAGEAPTLKKA